MIQLILNFRKSLANPNSKTIEERLSYYKKIESDLILHEDRFTGVLKSEISEALKDIDDLIDQLNKEKRNAKKSSTN